MVCCHTEERAQRCHAEERAQRCHAEERAQRCHAEERAQRCHAEERAQRVSRSTRPSRRALACAPQDDKAVTCAPHDDGGGTALQQDIIYSLNGLDKNILDTHETHLLTSPYGLCYELTTNVEIEHRKNRGSFGFGSFVRRMYAR